MKTIGRKTRYSNELKNIVANLGFYDLCNFVTSISFILWRSLAVIPTKNDDDRTDNNDNIIRRRYIKIDGLTNKYMINGITVAANVTLILLINTLIKTLHWKPNIFTASQGLTTIP